MILLPVGSSTPQPTAYPQRDRDDGNWRQSFSTKHAFELLGTGFHKKAGQVSVVYFQSDFAFVYTAATLSPGTPVTAVECRQKKYNSKVAHLRWVNMRVIKRFTGGRCFHVSTTCWTAYKVGDLLHGNPSLPGSTMLVSGTNFP
jgi:hypothetical protein